MSVLKKFKGHQTESFNKKSQTNLDIHQSEKKKKNKDKDNQKETLFTVGPMGNFSASTAAVEQQ